MAFTWLSPLNLIRSYRHVTALIHDNTNAKRERWVRQQRRNDPHEDFRLRRELPETFSFAILGDTGEGDASQWVVVDPFLRESADTSFTILASDVIYPSGRSASYRSKFYIPYRHYVQDIYAVPGNHDWYDELHGFMVHFCDNRKKLRNQDLSSIEDSKLERLRHIRENEHYQPNMYFYIDHPSLRIVCIDTGVKGVIDDDQLAWLHQVSQDPRPKILVSGYPVYYSGRRRRSLDNVLAVTERCNYVLVVGGDTHNFQRYRIPVEGGGPRRHVWHVVNGGGGAYARRTTRIPLAPTMDLGPFDLQEGADFACYPSREESTATNTEWWYKHVPSWVADSNAAPYYKSFLKLDVSPGTLRVRAFGVEDFARDGSRTGVVWDETIPLRAMT